MGYNIRSNFSKDKNVRCDPEGSHQHGYNHCSQMQVITGVNLRRILDSCGDDGVESLTGAQMIELLRIPLLILEKLKLFFPSNDCIGNDNPLEYMRIMTEDEKNNDGWMRWQRQFFTFSECPRDKRDPIVQFIMEKRKEQQQHGIAKVSGVPTEEELLENLDYLWIRSKIAAVDKTFTYGICPILADIDWYNKISNISKKDPEDCTWTLGSH